MNEYRCIGTVRRGRTAANIARTITARDEDQARELYRIACRESRGTLIGGVIVHLARKGD